MFGKCVHLNGHGITRHFEAETVRRTVMNRKGVGENLIHVTRISTYNSIIVTFTNASCVTNTTFFAILTENLRRGAKCFRSSPYNFKRFISLAFCSVLVIDPRKVY